MNLEKGKTKQKITYNFHRREILLLRGNDAKFDSKFVLAFLTRRRLLWVRLAPNCTEQRKLFRKDSLEKTGWAHSLSKKSGWVQFFLNLTVKSTATTET